MSRLFFAFDLDGTITEQEILPRIACELGLEKEIGELTRLTLDGTIDFERSFRLRFEILEKIPLERVRDIVAEIPLNPSIASFIRRNHSSCCVVTGNLDAWVAPLQRQLGCHFHSSESLRLHGKLALRSVMQKDKAIKKIARGLNHGLNNKIVAIGDSVNDMPMLRVAHIGVAYGGVHEPPAALLEVADYLVNDAESLCSLLESLKDESALEQIVCPQPAPAPVLFQASQI